ncbi:TonB-dependent receptor [Sphingomonas immobilis]|uniref:TonB-dependent receptor n=1 Tax=Sphingomonas immobilis TaxID=3063997 RepID=A0ABT9A175_9SPHN|nr:TonB-dependent receptor [Sphingomonas sp. CA1-15]MDO7843124.1 TonB-dependent receptor [Sphingomonas sp. CA1-15]
MTKFKYLVSAASGIALSAAIATPAYSQTSVSPPAAAPAAPPGETTIADIVVTAQKRAQKINDVGMSITAIGGEEMKKLGIVTTADLARIEPSFKYSYSSYGTPVLTLRGVGFNDVSLAASPTVSVYTDEIPYPYVIMTKGASFDNERVEVLKGPQGTLFGQNATGGAINYIAAKPTDHFTAGMDLTAARFGYVDAQGFVSGPVTDNLSVRLAGEITSGGAWQRSYTRNDTLLGDQKFYKARFLADWTPSSRLHINFSLNAWIDQSETLVPQLTAIVLNRPQAAAQVPSIVATPLAPDDVRSADWDPRYRPKNNEHFVQPALRVQFALTDDIDLIGLSSYIHYTGEDLRSNDGVAYENNKGLDVQESDNFYEELRLAGRLWDNRAHWVLGAQYSDDKSSENLRRYYFDSSPSFATTPRIIGGRLLAFDHGRTKAIYANADYKLTDQITLNGGIRYTKFDLEHHGCSQDPGGSLAALIGSIIGQPLGANQCYTILPDRTAGAFFYSPIHEDNVSWRAEADWKPNATTLLYASISKGYKAGTVPLLSANTYVAYLPVRQESLLSYEAGFKLGLFNRKLQLNASGFYYDYTDKQLFGRQLDPLGLFGSLIKLVNVPKSRVIGAEASAVLTPTRGLTLTGAISYIDSEVTDSFINYNNYGRVIDFKGLAFPLTPKWSGSVGVEYRHDIVDGKSAFVGANVTFQSHTVSSFGGENPQALGVPGYQSGDPSFNIPAYAYVDARAGLDISKEWGVEIFGKNVFNKAYDTDLILQNDTLGRRRGAPATYGITVRFRYK